MKKVFPYETCFAELVIKPIVSEEKDKFLALASLAEVSKFLPNIDSISNTDLLPIAFNACVVNRVNKNTDVIDTQTALGMYKNFINKPINIEHNRQKVTGVILTAGFSEFGTDKPLTEDAVAKLSTPFNITLGGVVWKLVSPDLAELIEDSGDLTSDNYLRVSASWELGFTGYRIALLDGGKKNLSDAKKILSDQTEIEAAEKNLIALGGTGKFDDLFAYRMPSFDVLPLGIGLTEKPAAEVKGVATPIKPQVGIEEKPAFGKPETDDEDLTEGIPLPTGINKNEVGIKEDPAFGRPADKAGLASFVENEKIISQSKDSNVKIDSKLTFMKISTIKDINAETLKATTHEAVASAVSEFIESELTKSSKEWETKKNELTSQVASATTKAQEASANFEKVQGEMLELKKQVQTLAQEKSDREAVDKFNSRMEQVVAAFDLSEEARPLIVEDLKAIASDEAFTKWMTKATVLYKAFAKKSNPFKKNDDKTDDSKDSKKADPKDSDKSKADDMDDDSEAKKKAKASEAKAALEKGMDNADKEKGGLPNGGESKKPTLMELSKTAFAFENVIINK